MSPSRKEPFPSPENDTLETPHPHSWQERVLEGLPGPDAETLRGLREILANESPGKDWYYGGAFADVSPLLLAPEDANHHWVDRTYDSRCLLYREDAAPLIQRCLKPLGIESFIAPLIP